MSNKAVAKQSTLWIGCDVASEKFDFCVHPEGMNLDTPTELRQLKVETVPLNADSVLSFVARFKDPKCVHVVMESTGRYSVQLATWMLEACPRLSISIVNPRKIKAHGHTLGYRNKTDRVDARVIASYGAKFHPKPWRPAASQHQSLQALMRTRQELMEQRTSFLNRLNDVKHLPLVAQARNAILMSLTSVIDELKSQVEELEKQLEQLLHEHMELKADIDLADTVPGIGRIVAATLLAELGDVRRFSSRKELEVFSGMNVGIRQSGRRLNTDIGLCRQGSSRIRRCLYLAAMSCVRSENVLSRKYRAMTHRGKAKKAALGCIMRKLLMLYRSVLISGQEYCDAYIDPKKTPVGAKT